MISFGVNKRERVNLNHSLFIRSLLRFLSTLLPLNTRFDPYLKPWLRPSTQSYLKCTILMRVFTRTIKFVC